MAFKIFPQPDLVITYLLKQEDLNKSVTQNVNNKHHYPTHRFTNTKFELDKI